MTAETLAKALGGRSVGARWMARCPAHEDRKPSLSISSGRNGKVLVHCHAGCDQGRVIATLRSCGLWLGDDRRRLSRSAPRGAATSLSDRDDTKRSKAKPRLPSGSQQRRPAARRLRPISSRADCISRHPRRSASIPA